MGAFISSVQVFTGDGTVTREAVMAVLRAGASGEDPVAVGPRVRSRGPRSSRRSGQNPTSPAPSRKRAPAPA